MPAPRRRALPLSVAVLLLLAAGDRGPLAAGGAPQDPVRRVVVVGFDGLDYATVDRMVSAGELPNFARLRSGTFAPLESTMPSESPTAWASLNTGTSPARTGVPGFVQRRLFGGQPEATFGHLEIRSGDTARPLAEIDGVPVPSFSRTMYAVLGGIAAALVSLALLLLVRIPRLVAVLVAVGFGVLGAFGAMRVRDWLPERYPVYANPNREPGFWDLAAKRGLRAVVIGAAQAWDQPTAENVRLLAGLGVPDARGGLGDWFLYTTNPDESHYLVNDAQRPTVEGRPTTTAGAVIRVDERGGRIDTELLGPVNFWLQEQLAKRQAELEREVERPDLGYKASIPLHDELRKVRAERSARPRLSAPLVVERDADGGGARVTIGGQTQRIAVGGWSDWYRVRYDLNPLVAVHAITRVKLVRTSPHVDLFVSRLDIDPARPAFWQPVSAPAEFSRALAKACGPFETYGWSTLTMPYKDRIIDAQTLLEDVEFTLDWRREVVLHAFDRADWDVFMAVYSTTDRVQHMLYAAHDPEHPAHDPEQAARLVRFRGATIPVSEAIPAIYREADRSLGSIVERLRADDLLVVVSDHGFQSFRWEVDVNQLLAEVGALARRDDLSAERPRTLPPTVTSWSHPAGRRGLGAYVDWSRTRAYSLGMGGVYLNLEGREGSGIVRPEDARAELEALRDALLAYRAPGSGRALVSQVVITAEERTGPYSDREPDLMIGFAEHHGPSWGARAGGASIVAHDDGTVTWGPLVTPNTNPWSGDHVGVDTRNVLGVFFSNRAFELPDGRPPHLLDVAPTLLAALGLPADGTLDRPPLRLVR